MYCSSTGTKPPHNSLLERLDLLSDNTQNTMPSRRYKFGYSQESPSAFARWNSEKAYRMSLTTILLASVN
jgi:hypothetical protein